MAEAERNTNLLKERGRLIWKHKEKDNKNMIVKANFKPHNFTGPQARFSQRMEC